MNDLTVKEVDLFGDDILAAKDNNGIVWASLSYMCRGLGMSKSGKDRQIQKVQNDEVLRRGCFKFEAGVLDPDNETIALQLDFVPIWLAKISVTPKMKRDNPELVNKLVQYQLKAKDILAAAFLPANNNPVATQDGIPIRLYPNSKWYILMIGDEVYSLKPNEAHIVGKCIGAMTKSGASQIIAVVHSLIEGFNRDCQLKPKNQCIVRESRLSA